MPAHAHAEDIEDESDVELTPDSPSASSSDSEVEEAGEEEEVEEEVEEAPKSEPEMKYIKKRSECFCLRFFFSSSLLLRGFQTGK